MTWWPWWHSSFNHDIRNMKRLGWADYYPLSLFLDCEEVVILPAFLSGCSIDSLSWLERALWEKCLPTQRLLPDSDPDLSIRSQRTNTTRQVYSHAYHHHLIAIYTVVVIVVVIFPISPTTVEAFFETWLALTLYICFYTNRMLSDEANKIATQLRQIADELNEEQEERKRRDQRRRVFSQMQKFLPLLCFVFYLTVIVTIRFRSLFSNL